MPHPTLSRRTFMKSTGATFALASLTSRAVPSRTHLVIITTDDNDADSLGCFGCPLPGITPHMDQLAAEGVRFEHAHTVSPTCQPTRLSLMTGCYPQNNGNTGHVDPLRPGVPTLASELKKAGYFTAIVGKGSNYLPSSAFQWDRSGLTADDWDDTSDGYWSMWRSPEGIYKGTKELIGNARDANKPFFLHLNTSDPHRPWPGSVDEVWFMKRFEKQWGKNKYMRPYPRNYSPVEVPVPGYLPDLAGVRVDLAQYYSGLHNADRFVGKILAALEEEGCRENTIVVCFGDQGMSMPPSKQNLYPFSTRIPLIIRWPGVTPPGHVVSDTMVEVIDIMPTLLEGLGLPVTPGMDGKSMLGPLRGRGEPCRDYVQKSYNYAFRGVQCFPMRAVQSKDFLYIYNAWPGEKNINPAGPLKYDGLMDPLTGLCWKSMKEAAKKDEALAKRVAFIRDRVPEEFYDLRTDPFCLNNLAGDPAHAKRMANMRDMVVKQMEETNDPLLAKFRGEGPIPEAWLTYTPRT